MWQWLQRILRKSPPIGNTSGSGNYGPVDAYRRQREPSVLDLVREFKGVSWSCANINANVCASHPPRLYVYTARGQDAPKCATRAIGRKALTALTAGRPVLPNRKAFVEGDAVAEVTSHPLLDLLARVNPVHNGYDLLELTQLYLEVCGVSYWKLELDDFGVPSSIWILPSQAVKAMRAEDSTNVVDYYSYRSGSSERRYEPDEVIAFRMPDVRDPYCGGMPPTRAAFEQIKIASEYTAFKFAKF